MNRICVSFSGWNLYQSCPSAFQRKYILKEEVPEGEGEPSPAMLRGLRVHRDTELYLKDHTDELPEEAKPFGQLLFNMKAEREPQAELRWAVDPEWEEVKFHDTPEAMTRGIYDIAYEYEDTAFVFEIKTGKKYPEHSEQRSLYGTAAFTVFPEVPKVVVTTLYYDQGTQDVLELERSMALSYRYVWERHINQCQPPQDYRARPSWKCRFCVYNIEKGGKCTAGKGKTK